MTVKTLALDDRAGWGEFHRQLLSGIERNGLSAPTLASNSWRGFYVTAMYALSWVGLLTGPSWPERVVLLLGMTFATFHAGLVAHDISHRTFTKNRALTRGLGQFFMSFIGGQAYAHWEWQHLTHHRFTQHIDNDPDLDVDFFALTEASAQRKRGLLRWTTKHQSWLLWPSSTLQGFSIRANTVRYLIRHWRTTTLDAVVFAAHLAFWLVLPALIIGWPAALLNYVIGTWFIGPLLTATFIWNHVGTPDVDAQVAEPAYAAHRVLTSRNLGANPIYTFVFGALNFHIEHHLAPHVPTDRLPKVRPLLDTLLAGVGVQTQVVSFGKAMVDVQRHLASISASMKTSRSQPAAEANGVPERQLHVADANRSA